VRVSLNRNLAELGFVARPSGEILATYAGVQNTYLATFVSLGGLGLLLGTLGFVIVLLRSVAERRGELAMMLALGLGRGRLFVIIVAEHGLLLALGMAIGSVAALVAVTPQLLSAMAEVGWVSLAETLLGCVFAGVAACAIAAASAVRGELLSALRSE